MGAVNPASSESEDPKPPSKTESKSLKINLDSAVEVKLPAVRGLKAVNFHTSDGKEGWVLRLPGNRPIATPAYPMACCLLAADTAPWSSTPLRPRLAKSRKINTNDDGLTAAVVEGGYVPSTPRVAQ
jgi:hypothetical protein